MAKGMCSVDGCDRPAFSRGRCSRHYAAWRRAGGTGRVCTIDGCDNPYFGCGWCEMHYDRCRSNGDPGIVSVIMGDDVRRFWTHVDRRGPDECWPWMKTITFEGYGVFEIQHHQVKAHRHVYELVVGPILEDLTIDHLCHTNDPTCTLNEACPHRRCCNPAHLEPVPNAENIRRGHRSRKTHCPQGHPYSGDNVSTASGYVRCKTCHRLQEAARRRRSAP